jgi:hypothetical protein
MKKIIVEHPNGTKEEIHRVVSFEIMDEADMFCIDCDADGITMGHFPLPLSEEAKMLILRRIETVDYRKFTLKKNKL